MDKTKIGVIAATAILGLGALGGAAVKASASSSPGPMLSVSRRRIFHNTSTP